MIQIRLITFGIIFLQYVSAFAAYCCNYNVMSQRRNSEKISKKATEKRVMIHRPGYPGTSQSLNAQLKQQNISNKTKKAQKCPTVLD